MTEYEARSRFGMRRSTAGHTPEEWDPGRSAGSGFYIGGQFAKWDAARTTPSWVGHASWNESWQNCSQGQSGGMSAGTDGADSAQRRCTRRETPCPTSNHGTNGDQPKRHVDALNVRKKALSDLSQTGQEPQIPSARICKPTNLPDSKSAMYGGQDCSPATFLATVMIATTVGGAARASRGAVTPRFKTENVCRWRTAGFGFAHKPSRKMTLNMVDVFLMGTVPVHGTVSSPPPSPPLSPWVAVDAAEAGRGEYHVGVSCRNGAFRSRTFMLQNQQQGELQGMGYATSLVERFGWSSASGAITPRLLPM